MTKYRDCLPQLSEKLFLTDGGLETTLLFHDGLELPCFAAFDLLHEGAGYSRLRDYFRDYALLAREHGLGFVLESATWRASSDWGDRLGYTARELDEANRKAIELLLEIREQLETGRSPMVVSGCIGPRGDGYVAADSMGREQAELYHGPQIRSLSDAGVDLVSAFTIPTSEEAIGMIWAAGDAQIPVVISFTVETDGHLPSGQSLGEAITEVDEATDAAPAYYMINCAHPSHFEQVLSGNAPWRERIRGVRANASCKSHAELDESETLDEGDPDELAGQYRELQRLLPNLRVLGGCCGTDHRHVEAICLACAGR